MKTLITYTTAISEIEFQSKQKTVTIYNVSKTCYNKRKYNFEVKDKEEKEISYKLADFLNIYSDNYYSSTLKLMVDSLPLRNIGKEYSHMQYSMRNIMFSNNVNHIFVNYPKYNLCLELLRFK